MNFTANTIDWLVRFSTHSILYINPQTIILQNHVLKNKNSRFLFWLTHLLKKINFDWVKLETITTRSYYFLSCLVYCLLSVRIFILKLCGYEKIWNICEDFKSVYVWTGCKVTTFELDELFEHDQRYILKAGNSILNSFISSHHMVFFII